MIWVNAKGQCIIDEAGNPERLSGVILNITSLKANRDERERNAMLAIAVSNERDNLLRLFEDVTNPSAMWIGEDLIFDRVNLPYQNLFAGRKLLGRKLEDALPDDVNAPLHKTVREVFKTGVRFKISEQLIVDRWYDSEFFQIKDQFGKAYGVYQQTDDVSEYVLARKNAEVFAAELELQTAKLEAMFTESPMGICLLRGESLVCEKTNDNFQKLVSPREYVGRTWEEIYSELKGSELPEIMRTVLRTGNPYRAIELKIPVLFDSDQPEDRYYNFTYNRISASDGTSYGIFCQCSDVTDGVAVRLKLAASDEALRLALAGGHMGTWFVDLSTNKTTFDARARDLNCLTSGDQPIGTIARLAHEDDRGRIEESLKNAITNQTPFECEYRIKQPDGLYRWIYARGEPKAGEDGSVQSITGVTFDISERKSAAFELLAAKEVADRANQTKSSFLANMSHEIRTPLGAILGFTDLLKEGNLDIAERQQFLDTISRNGRALTRIIDDILDLAKVESGKLEVEQIEFSFLDLIDDVMDLFRERTRAKGIFLRAHTSRNIPTRIISDPTRLRQILINVVGNAVKFTDSGGVTLDADAVLNDRNETEFQIHVCDTGIGVSEEEQGRLFKPFVQADNSTTRKFGGTGLGLALSKRLASALGGDVRVRTNSPKPGSTFTVSFIVKIATKSAIAAPVSAKPKLASGSAHLLDGIRVLVADDSEDNLLLITLMLTRFGATVETADNGVQAFHTGIAGNFDIILMDIQMPEMDGYEATRSLREAGFKKPIIALTAHAMAEERARTKAAGCDGHLTKPLNQDELIETVHRFTANH